MIRIITTSVFVDDQAKALDFYTKILGFTLKDDVPMDGARWLTVTSQGDPDGVQLLLEPSDHPAVPPYKEALVADGIPATQFGVDDVYGEVERLKSLGVTFVQEATDLGPVTVAVLDDTCGNLIQIATMN